MGESMSATAPRAKGEVMSDKLVEKVASRFMVQCRNSKDFECPYLNSCPHEDKEVCQWQLDQAKELIPIIKKAVAQASVDWFNGTCQHRVPFHTRWQCGLCKDIFFESLKKRAKEGEDNG